MRQNPLRSRPARAALIGVCSLMLLLVGVLMSAPASPAALSPLETRVLGQTRWLAGGPAALRIIVMDHKMNVPVRAKVTLTLTSLVNGQPREKAFRLFAGSTGPSGTLEAAFTAPDAPEGAYQLTVSIDSYLGTDVVTQSIQLADAVQVLLTCDKPLYQPGQIIHLRALALNIADLEPARGQTVIFEIEDARANKVYKQKETLNEFGVAGVDFELASEVNMGTFTLRAIVPAGQAEKKVRVERYVLPKYRVGLTTDKTYYLPGETVKGTLQADYFFGKPVAGGSVTIQAQTVNIGVDTFAELTGKTDANGTYQFEVVLPKAFVGQPFEQGKAVASLHATIIDAAEHQQEATATFPVVKDSILLAIIPENPRLVRGIENRAYIAAATPDGKPLANATLTVGAMFSPQPWQPNISEDWRGIKLITNDLGMAVFKFQPVKGYARIFADVKTAGGATASARLNLNNDTTASDGIILRGSHAVAKVGDRVLFGTLSTAQKGTTYLDIVRNRQTILTKALETNNGKAELRLAVTPDMVGTIEVHAYRILPNEDIIRDTLTMVVLPAGDLDVSVKPNKAVYRPGEEAVLDFQVRDGKTKHPVFAALGLAIVDESVFALSELQPGLEKIYFMLEKELMEPRYEIHGLTSDEIIMPPIGIDPVRPIDPVALEGARQMAGAALFAAVPAREEFDFRVNTYQQRWEKLRGEVMAEMTKEHAAIVEALEKHRQKIGKSLTATESLFKLVDEGLLKIDTLKDRWGNFYVSDLHGQTNYEPWAFTLGSAGPDGRWSTVDDITGVTSLIQEVMVEFDGPVRGGGPRILKAGDGVDMPMAMAGAAAPREEAITAATTGETAAAEPPRVREYFPETLYWNPSLITDDNGRARLKLPMADSITSWRISMFASGLRGQMGSATSALKVFQDFFVDIDFPVSLTQGDRVEVPVAIYNYLPGPQTVTLTVEDGNWFKLDGALEQRVQMGKDEVKVVYFPITVTGIGRFAFTVTAKGTAMSDAIRRSIDVLPDGQEVRTAVSDRLEGKIEKTITIPAEAIDGASNVWVKLYPGAFSQLVEGLDGMLRMPGGCFEQTSSTTYPNLLVLDYLKGVKKINPEIRMKAEQYVNVGYQRLVTFECKSGGFSWFGDEPAHQILTAYGLLEFSDMAKVHEVDPALISRTQAWLAGKQQGDGSWEEKNRGIAEGIIDRQTGALRSTAYIAWALAESGYKGPELVKGAQYVLAHRAEAKDPYTLAVILNLLTKTEPQGATTTEVAEALIKLATVTEKNAYWKAETQTFTGANDRGADLETTGLAAYGLVKWGRNTAFVNKVLTYLIQSKDSFGTWSTTQGTVWSLKTLIYASTNAFGGGTGTVTIFANGQKAAAFTITVENNDVMRQADLANLIQEGENNITLQYDGDGSLLYQIAARYYIPWNLVEKMPEAKGPLDISVQYDKTRLSTDDLATVTVTVQNVSMPRATVEMPLIDIGLPPGFTPVTDALDKAVAEKVISKYTIAARQIIIYIEKLEPGKRVTLTYQLKARYPIRARTPQSRAYPYYNPEKADVSAPQQVTVTK